LVADTVSVDGHDVVLDADVWRNFQPGPPNSRLLIAVVQITVVDSLAMPADVSLQHIWVLNGPDWWSAQFTAEERPPTPDYQLERAARCGPQWTPGAVVDVIVQVGVGADQVAYVRRSGVVIGAPE